MGRPREPSTPKEPYVAAVDVASLSEGRTSRMMLTPTTMKAP